MEPQNPQTRILPCDKAAIAEAARLILQGEVVAVPTETVYGLAADATNPAAVEAIYAAKGRPAFNPLIVHVRDISQADTLGRFGAAARALADAHWPGPLTLVVPLSPAAGIAPRVTAGLSTIAIRSPAHPAMQALLAATGRPLAAPSANASGQISPTEAGHVFASLGGRIPLILDGGATRQGVESTIVRVDDGSVVLLRPGPILIDESETLPSGSPIQAPGQMASHYAPSKPVRLDARSAGPDEWLIGFGAVQGQDNLSVNGDLEEAAARLFAALHRAEASGKTRIAVAAIPESGIGIAINDRLRRAAAPRSGT